MDKFEKVYEYQWKIHNFTRSSTGKYRGQKQFVTNKFSMAQEESIWQFAFFVDAIQGGLFLNKIRGSLIGSLQVKASISINDGIQVCHESSTKEIKDDCPSVLGWRIFLLTDDMLKDNAKYISNDTLTFEMKLKLVPKPEEKESIEPNALAAFQDFHNSSKFSDFSFLCSDKKSVPAHRMILYIGSPVMKSMLDAQMSETSSNTAKISDIDSETIIELLRFMYVRQVENIDEIAPKLLYAANKYQEDALKLICVSSMIKNMTLDNAIDHFILAYQLDEQRLLYSCLEFIKGNYSILRQDDKWNDLDQKMLNVILDYFDKAIKTVKTVFENWL